MSEIISTAIPVMISIKEAAERFNLPENLIRQLVITKKVFSIQSGKKKYYLNLGSLVSFLNTGDGGVR